MPNCLSRPLRICEAWIRIRESSIFWARQVPGHAAVVFLIPQKTTVSETVFGRLFKKSLPLPVENCSRQQRWLRCSAWLK